MVCAHSHRCRKQQLAAKASHITCRVTLSPLCLWTGRLVGFQADAGRFFWFLAVMVRVGWGRVGCSGWETCVVLLFLQGEGQSGWLGRQVMPQPGYPASHITHIRFLPSALTQTSHRSCWTAGLSLQNLPQTLPYLHSTPCLDTCLNAGPDAGLLDFLRRVRRAHHALPPDRKRLYFLHVVRGGVGGGGSGEGVD